MPYQVSYLVDVEHKFDFMNVSYNGNSQAPIGYWPLEFGNLENIKSIEQGCLVRWLNEATSRLGAIIALPLTLLDMTITGIAVTIMHRMYLIRGGQSTKNCVALLSNRMYGNLAILGLIAIRILAGPRVLTWQSWEAQLDRFITRNYIPVPPQRHRSKPIQSY